MSCEKQLNALRRAEQALADYRRQRPGSDTPEEKEHLAELTAALREKQEAYNWCRGQGTPQSGIESLMRDEFGKPLGGGAGPPM
ncbi:hypothetical protein [Catenulispora subtropica]|uniref:Uncharacterized protein n=1 Tax=Catenulispora subtropica TaxID=450798 RepID=A0ABP5DZ24_9ACTN